MLNHIVVMGRLVRDPDMRNTNSGTAVANFTLAVDRGFAPKDGGEKETDFIDVVAWRSTAEFVDKYFSKGRMAVVSGRLQTRNWTDDAGNKRKSVEIVAEHVYFGDSKKDQSSGSQGGEYTPSNVTPIAQAQTGGFSTAAAQDFEEITTDEELPF